MAVVILSNRSSYDGSGAIIEAQADTQAELTSDSRLNTCAPGSIVTASDLSFRSNKKNDGTWNTVTAS